MIKFIIITISFSVSILLLSLNSWFELEKTKIIKITDTNIQNIKKIKKINQINSWLDANVRPDLKEISPSDDKADENLIKYFDKNSKKYNFSIKKYIYADEDVKKFDISYEVNKNNKKHLNSFMHLDYQNGFLEFKKLKINNKNVIGKIQLVQSYKEDKNETK